MATIFEDIKSSIDNISVTVEPAEGAATEAKQDALIAAIQGLEIPAPVGGATEETLEALLNKVIVSPSTAAKQDELIAAINALKGTNSTLEDVVAAIEAIVIPAPVGASTEAKQDTGNSSLATIAGKDFATQTTLNSVLSKLSSDPATQTTLAAILAKIIASPSTAANQATIIGHLDGVEGSLTTISGKDFATQTTLAAVLSKITSDPATQTTVAAILAKLTADPATNTKLDDVITAIESISPGGGGGGDASAANQETQITAEQAILAKLSADPATNAKLDDVITAIGDIPGGGSGGDASAANQETIIGQIGEVQASPTANTLLDRLKSLYTAITGTLVVATHAVTQSGTWTVQPGNTANTTAWKVDGSAVTQPVSGTVSVNTHAVTVASGGVASGAIASGAIASGAVASGAFASGSVSDGAVVTIGTRADNKSTATDTTAITAMSVWKQISASVQAMATALAGSITVATHAVTQSGSWVLSAGSAIVGKVGIDQTTDGTTNLVAAKQSGSWSVTANLSTTDNTVLDNIEAGIDELKTQVDLVTAAVEDATGTVGTGADSAGALVTFTSEAKAQLGSLTETAPATDTASSGISGRLQRVSQRITSLIALFPTSVGSKADSASLAVTNSTEDKAAIGSLTETAPASDTASSGLNGRFQRVAQRLSTLIGLFPAALGLGGGLKVDDIFSQYETVAASQTAQTLGATGASGDYLAGVLVFPGTAGCGPVTVLDNANTIGTFPGGGTTALPSLVPFLIPVGLYSTSGAWKVTTGANVTAVGIGKFT